MTEVWEKITSFEALYKAAKECRRNVMWKASVAGFIANLAQNVVRLMNELRGGTYKLSKYSIFFVCEKKLRKIVATRIRDRVVQRSICENYLTEQVSKSFIYDNAACQKNKGTDFARKRLEHHLRSYFEQHGRTGYVLKIDIKDYFGSTPHIVAKQAMRKRVDDPYVLQYVEMVIDSFDCITPGKGIGLGSELSQLIQLAILDDIDHRIKQNLKIKHYVRYMDDLILIHESYDHLQMCLADIQSELAKLQLQVNTKKTRIQPIGNGIHFLGFSFRLNRNGTVTKSILHSRIGKQRRRMKKQAELLSYEKAVACLRSNIAHMEKGDCEYLIQKQIGFFNSLRKDDEYAENH